MDPSSMEQNECSNQAGYNNEYQFEILTVETVDGDKVNYTLSGANCKQKHIVPTSCDQQHASTGVLSPASTPPRSAFTQLDATRPKGIVSYPNTLVSSRHSYSCQSNATQWIALSQMDECHSKLNRLSEEDTEEDNIDIDNTQGTAVETIHRGGEEEEEEEEEAVSQSHALQSSQSKPIEPEPCLDLVVNVRLKRRPQVVSQAQRARQSTSLLANEKCLPSIDPKMVFSFSRPETIIGGHSKQLLFIIIVIFSIVALVLLHNGSLHTRKTPTPTKFFYTENSFISDFEFGQLKDLWSRIAQNEVSFIIYYAPWDADCIRARNEFDVVANHYGQQIFFGAINCWWPEGECRKYQSIRRYPHLIAHVRTQGEVEYKGPILASYIIPFLDNILNPVVPIQNEGELLDLRAKHDAVLLGYFNFMQVSHQSSYRSYLALAIKALVNDPWRDVAYTVVSSARMAAKLRIDPQKEPSLLLFVGNSTEQFTAKHSKHATTLSWIYSRARLAQTLKWITFSGVKSSRLSDYIRKNPTLILFTPRNLILGISPYFDLLREMVLDYYNCDHSPVIRSLIHRNILQRRLLEDRLAELEERCHELLDEIDEVEEEKKKRFTNHEDTCCHSQTVHWRAYGGARHGMSKRCLCTSCVHISLPKCPAKCSHFDCFSTASRFLDDFDPNAVNNSAVYCNQIRTVYEPKYTSYYKISTTCSGILTSDTAAAAAAEEDGHWFDVHRQEVFSHDDRISRMIQDFEIQHCRRLKLGMNYTDLNFPDSYENRQTGAQWRANFTGLACRTNRTLQFASIDSSLYPAFAESLGIDVFNVPHSTVALIIDPSNENVHLLKHDIRYREIEVPNYEGKSIVHIPINSYSKRSFMEFIKNFTDGTLPRFMRSQLVSSSGLCDLRQMVISEEASKANVICVPELNSLTFVSLVLGKSALGNESTDAKMQQDLSFKLLEKDILVMYYAPWCGFCTSIAHIYLDVARFFAFSKDIIFTRINGDANDLPWEYTVDRYPTIMFFPAKRRSHSLVYPANKMITKSSLLDFILKHGQLSVRIETLLRQCKRACVAKSLVTSHFYRRKLARSIWHHLQAHMLAKYQIDMLDKKIKHATTNKQINIMNTKKDELRKYMHYIRTSLRKLRRIQSRHSLFNFFLLGRIEQLRKLDSNKPTTAANNLSKLSKELYRLVSHTTKQEQQTNGIFDDKPEVSYKSSNFQMKKKIGKQLYKSVTKDEL